MAKRRSAHRHLLVLNTCPDVKTATRLAGVLVHEKLATCVNIAPLSKSIYRWRGKVESAKEVLLLIKTSSRHYPAVEARIRSLHPYELPEIISVGLAGGYARYLAWLDNPDKTR